MEALPQLFKLLRSNVLISEPISCNPPKAVKLIVERKYYGMTYFGPNDEMLLGYHFLGGSDKSNLFKVGRVYFNPINPHLDIELKRIIPWYKLWDEGQVEGRYRLFASKESLDAKWEKDKQYCTSPEEYVIPWEYLKEHWKID